MYTNDADFWQYEEDIFSDLFQQSRDDLLQLSHDNFQPYSMGYDTYSFEHVIAQFVARSKGYKVEGQTGVTGTYPTQCHHDGEVLSL
jgi:hypothetical protein